MPYCTRFFCERWAFFCFNFACSLDTVRFRFRNSLVALNLWNVVHYRVGKHGSVFTNRWLKPREDVWSFRNQTRRLWSPESTGSTVIRRKSVSWRVTWYAGNVVRTRQCVRLHSHTFSRCVLHALLHFRCSSRLNVTVYVYLLVCNTLDICVTFGSLASVVFNAKKSLCVAVSKKIM